MVKLFCAIVGVAGSAFSVRVDENDSVDELKKAIKEENSDDPTLKNVAAKNLRLYLAKTASGAWLSSKNPAVISMRSGGIPDEVKTLLNVEMDPADEIGDLFDLAPTKTTIHVLVVGPDESNQVAMDRPSRSARTHSENRRKRWRELNDILDKNKNKNKNKKAKTNGEDSTSTAYSYVKWSEVKGVLDYERYRQERKPIPEDKFKFLCDYLVYASEAMNGYVDAPKEAKRYHFIVPVLIMLCSLLVDVKLEVEETVDGNEVHANGHFEFVLTRGKTKICIVEAKRNDFDQGKAQALVGCEAVADSEGLYVVYGIVTDFIKWYLYRSGENSILMDSSTLSAKSEVLDIGSLRDVCEMIYGALLNHEDECNKEKPICVE